MLMPPTDLAVLTERLAQQDRRADERHSATLSHVDEVKNELLTRIEGVRTLASATNGRVSELEALNRVADAVNSSRATDAAAAAAVLHDKAHDVAEGLKETAAQADKALDRRQARMSVRWTVIAMVAAALLSGLVGDILLGYFLNR